MTQNDTLGLAALLRRTWSKEVINNHVTKTLCLEELRIFSLLHFTV